MVGISVLMIAEVFMNTGTTMGGLDTIPKK